MLNGQEAPQLSFFDRLKDNLNPTNLMERLNLSKNKLIELGLYLGIGFLSGFLFKKYFKYMLVFVAFIGCLYWLQYMNVITVVINADRAQEIFGVQPGAVFEDAGLMSQYWEWVKANVALVLTYSIGFFIGLKLG